MKGVPAKWLTFTCLVRSYPGTAVQAKWKSGRAYFGFASGLAHERRSTSKWHITFIWTRISENLLHVFVWFWVASQVILFHLACTPVPRYGRTFTWASQVTRHWSPRPFTSNGQVNVRPYPGTAVQAKWFFFTSFARESQMFFLPSFFWTAVCQDFWFKILMIVAQMS